MTEWPQKRLEKFWRGLDWTTHEAVSTLTGAHYEDVWYDEKMECRMEGLSDPHDEDKVRLEVLLDGLEKLDEEAFVLKEAKDCYRVDTPYWEKANNRRCLSRGPDRRTAIIAAICSLINIDCED